MAAATASLPRSPIRITEVGPRDGLQNEKTIIPTETKVAFINALSETGCAEIEVTSFVSPKWVPQLADAAEVLARIRRNPRIVYSALVPNMQGFEAALAAGANRINIFTAASETFNQKNINSSIAQSLERLNPVIRAAESAGIFVRAYISCAVACPYEGPIDPSAVVQLAQTMLEMGVDEIDLGDTIGVAVPTDIRRLYDAISEIIEPSKTTLHLHDTRGAALACALAAYEWFGVRSFDSSAGGLGGCPYAPGAAGNIATEDLVYVFEKMNIPTGIDLGKLVAAGRIVESALGRPLPGRTYRAEAKQQPSSGT